MIKLEQIEELVKQFPDKLAIVSNDRTWSWKDYREVTAKMATTLLHLKNFSNSNAIIFLSENSDYLIFLGSALNTLSVPFVGVDPHQNFDRTLESLNQLKCKRVFISKRIAGRVPSSLLLSCGIEMSVIEDFFQNWNEVNEISKSTIDFFTQTRSFSSFSLTSGTTGIPKIVKRSRSSDARRFLYLKKRYQFTGEDVHLTCLPMHHAGTINWLRMFLSYGSTVVIDEYSNALQLAHVLETWKVTTSLMSPFIVESLVNIFDSNQTRLFPDLRFIITGGKRFKFANKRIAMSKLGPVIHEYYGTTETGINVLSDPKDLEKYPLSVGMIFEGNEIVILGENNQCLAPMNIGRIAIHSYMNMDAYVNAESQFLESKGKYFVMTSDFGYLNEEDYLFIAQRFQKFPKYPLDIAYLENMFLHFL